LVTKVTPVQLAVALQSLLGRASEIAGPSGQSPLVGAVVDIPQPQEIGDFLTNGQILDMVESLPNRRKAPVLGSIGALSRVATRKEQFASQAALGAPRAAVQAPQKGNQSSTGNQSTRAPGTSWKPRTFEEYTQGKATHEPKACRAAIFEIRNTMCRNARRTHGDAIPRVLANKDWQNIPEFTDEERLSFREVEAECEAMVAMVKSLPSQGPTPTVTRNETTPPVPPAGGAQGGSSVADARRNFVEQNATGTQRPPGGGKGKSGKK